MRTAVFIALAIAALATSARAAPLAPVTGAAATPLPQLLATADVLGEWPLLSGGRVRLIRVMSRNGGECGVSDADDSNTCPRYALFVALNGETSIPVDFTLFRLPDTIGWELPEGCKAGRDDYGRFAIPLLACEMTKTSKGFGWKGVSLPAKGQGGPEGGGPFRICGRSGEAAGRAADVRSAVGRRIPNDTAPSIAWDSLLNHSIMRSKGNSDRLRNSRPHPYRRWEKVIRRFWRMRRLGA